MIRVLLKKFYKKRKKTFNILQRVFRALKPVRGTIVGKCLILKPEKFPFYYENCFYKNRCRFACSVFSALVRTGFSNQPANYEE